MDSKPEENFKRYTDHSARFQTWIAAYGAALAATTFAKILPAVPQDQRPKLKNVLILVSIALGLQIVLVLVNKYSQWLVHRIPMDKKLSPWDSMVNSFTERIWIDAIADICSLALLGWATLVLLDYVTVAVRCGSV